VFTKDGKFVQYIGNWKTGNNGNGDFYQAAMIWSVNSQLYVADSGNHRIQVFI